MDGSGAGGRGRGAAVVGRNECKEEGGKRRTVAAAAPKGPTTKRVLAASFGGRAMSQSGKMLISLISANVEEYRTNALRTGTAHMIHTHWRLVGGGEVISDIILPVRTYLGLGKYRQV